MIATAQFTISIVNDGVGIVENVIEYCISTSGTIVPGSPLTDGSGNIIYDVNGLILTDGAWSSTMPQSTDGDYIWTRSKTVYSDGNFALAYMVSHHGEDGAVGATGVSVVKVTPEYRLSDSSTSLTGTGEGYSWSTSKPNVESGQFIWERQKTDLSDGTAVYSDAVCDIVMSGLVFDVDKANKSIEQKVWASDITNSINSYDGTTGVAIRDQVAQHTQTLNGFETRISANETAISTKADGSQVAQMSTKLNEVSDTVDGHTQSISATNTRIDNLKLGTKNYIQNSEIFDKTKAPYTTSTASGPQSSPAAKDGQAAYNNGSGGKIIVTFPQLVSGKEYVFSFDWNRPYTVQTLRTVIGGTNYDETTVNDAVWHRKEIKFTANANTTEAQIYINQSGASYTLYVRHFQLELGNIASDWHESPEDVEAEITSVKTTAEQTADHLSWVIEESGKTASTFTFKSRVMSLINADLVIKDPAGSSTIISGGKINANSITTNMLASNAIKSINYISGSSTDVPDVVSQDIPARYSTTGTFLDLSNGALYMPNFNVDSSGQVFMNGTVYANAGQIGDPGNAYWEIGTIYDDDWGDHAGLIAHGDAIIQADKLTLSDNRLNSENQGNYIAYDNKWYDFGFQVPDFTTNNTHRDNVFYIRSINYQPTSATLDSDWTYLFRVDKKGDIYWNGHDISTGTFVPLSGGVTMTGSLTVPTLTVTGTLTGTASAAQKLTPGKTIQTNLASTSAVTFTGESNVTPGVTGTLGVGNGGTGKASWTQWGIVYASTTTALSQVGAGTSGQVLKSNGSAAPRWIDQSSISAGTATKWASAQTVYVTLGTASTTTAIQGGSSTAQTIGVNGTLGVGNGGTGATTFTSGAALIGNGTGAIQTRTIRNNTTAGALGWTANATDTTLVTTNTIAYWDGRYKTTDNASNLEYVKLGKLGTVVTHAFDEFITTSGGIIDGSLSVTELTAGNLIVTGAGRFTNGLYGDLIGNATTATTATQVGNNLKIQLNSGTTEGTNQFTYNGSAVKNINITKSSIGLGNVENTALSTWAGSANLTTTKVGTLAGAAVKAVDTSISAGSSSANLPTSAAVASFVEGKGYVTSSGVTSVQVQATSPVVSSTNTAQSSTLNTTISLANAYGDTKNPYGTKTANYVLAGPSSGSAAAPTFRALVAADIPTLAASKVGLGNVTNNKQVKATASAVTGNNLVIWSGTTGDAVADSGIAKTGVATKLTLAGTDYTVSSNAITVTQANLQSAVQSTGLVLMTSAERSKLSSIQVSEGGTIDFSGVTATAPITATVAADKTVNITHNTSGVSAGTYRSVTVNTYGHVTAGTNPTTLSGYGITDAKIASGVITLGSNTITPLTASSTLDATKLSGTASISTTGNASTATTATTAGQFTSAQSITLTGDTTGTASSQAGWSIATSNIALSCINNGGAAQSGASNRPTTANTSYHDGKLRYYLATSAMSAANGKPSADGGILHLAWDNTGYDSQLAVLGNSGSNTGLEIRSSNSGGTWGDWIKVLTSVNYNTYSPKLDGTGATGNWNINASTATKANITTTANAIAKYSDIEGTFANSNVYITNGDVVIGSTDSSGNTSGEGNFKIGVKNDSYGIMPYANNWNQIGSSSIYWYRSYINHYYGSTSHITNWDAGKNIGSAATTSAAATRGSVYFYNTCAANGTQTKTLLDANASASSNITITLPSTAGTLALTSSDITGNASTATKWASAQTVYVTLGTASTTTTIQGGSSSAQTIGVNGTLGVGNGGTGKTSGVDACNYFLNSLTTGASDPVDADYYISQYVNGGTTTTTYHRRPMSALWNYVNGKAGSVYAKLSGAAFTGAVTGTSFAASSYLSANSGNSGTAGGLALWSTDPTAYGIMLRTTANQGKHGYVQGEYAAYLTMSGATASAAETRGWVFKNKMANACVASISALGHAVFNGSVTVGGNTTNTSGARFEYNTVTQSIDFIFN